MVKKYQESFPSILKYVWQEDNGFRAAASRNNGINELSGDVEYIVIIDGKHQPIKYLPGFYPAIRLKRDLLQLIK